MLLYERLLDYNVVQLLYVNNSNSNHQRGQRAFPTEQVQWPQFYRKRDGNAYIRHSTTDR